MVERVPKMTGFSKNTEENLRLGIAISYSCDILTRVMRYIPGVIVNKTDTILFLVVTYTVTGHEEHEDFSESIMSLAVLTQHSLCDGV